MGALKIEYVQTVVHSLVRQEGVPLLFGREWTPISLPEASTYFPYFLACWVGLAVVVVVVRATRKLEIPAPLRSLLWSSLALSIIFFALTVLQHEAGDAAVGLLRGAVRRGRVHRGGEPRAGTSHRRRGRTRGSWPRSWSASCSR